MAQRTCRVGDVPSGRQGAPARPPEATPPRPAPRAARLAPHATAARLAPVAPLALALALMCALAGCAAPAVPDPATTPARDATAQPAPSDEPATVVDPTPQTGRRRAAATPAQLLASLSLEEKACQLLIVTPEALTGSAEAVTRADDALAAALRARPVGGLILFDDNLQTPEQTRALLAGVADAQAQAGGVPLFLAVDEEGGAVARCARSLGTTAFEPMFSYRDAGADTARANARTIAADISALGFNLDFAPVADTWSNPDNVAIGTRAYSDSFDGAAQLVAAAVEGFHEGGVACTLKHFPGLGDTLADPHDGTVTTDRDLAALRAGELVPFAAGIAAGADLVMVGHITCTAVDDVPATFSRTLVTDVLRGELGFSGVVVSDAMNMGAIADEYSDAEAAVRALEAGVDVVLMPGDVDAVVDAVVAAVGEGRLSEEGLDESVLRVLACKRERGLL